MKHCDFCNVDVENKKVHCPLCGKSLDDEKVKMGIINHSDIYPDYLYKFNKTNLICKIIAHTLFVLTLICLFCDILTTHKISYSLIVVASFVYIYFGILKPVRKNKPIENLTIQLSFFSALLILFIEFYTKTALWGYTIVIPSIFMALSLFALIIMLIKKFVDFDMLKPIVINLILDTILLIVLLAIGKSALIAIISFLFNLGIVLFLLIFRFKYTSKSIKKEFRF